MGSSKSRTRGRRKKFKRFSGIEWLLKARSKELKPGTISKLRGFYRGLSQRKTIESIVPTLVNGMICSRVIPLPESLQELVFHRQKIDECIGTLRAIRMMIDGITSKAVCGRSPLVWMFIKQTDNPTETLQNYLGSLIRNRFDETLKYLTLVERIRLSHGFLPPSDMLKHFCCLREEPGVEEAVRKEGSPTFFDDIANMDRRTGFKPEDSVEEFIASQSIYFFEHVAISLEKRIVEAITAIETKTTAATRTVVSPPLDIDPLIDIDQAAAIVHCSRKTLNNLRCTDQTFPIPDRPAGSGRKKNLWRWSKIKPFLEGYMNQSIDIDPRALSPIQSKPR